jgi:hypothetical protein
MVHKNAGRRVYWAFSWGPDCRHLCLGLPVPWGQEPIGAVLDPPCEFTLGPFDAEPVPGSPAGVVGITLTYSGQTAIPRIDLITRPINPATPRSG